MCTRSPTSEVTYSDLAVLAQEHAFRLGAGRHLVHDDVLRSMSMMESVTLLVGDIDAPALLVEAKVSGLGPVVSLPITSSFATSTMSITSSSPQATYELRTVGAEVHVARAAADS